MEQLFGRYDRFGGKFRFLSLVLVVHTGGNRPKHVTTINTVNAASVQSRTEIPFVSAAELYVHQVSI